VPKVKPGWYVLAAVTLYAVIVTVLLATREPPTTTTTGAKTAATDRGASPRAGDPGVADGSTSGSSRAGGAAGGATEPEAAVSASTSAATTVAQAASGGAAGLWYPIPGVRLPRTDSNLPGAERAYRDGVSQGFDFHAGDVEVPVPYGAAVIAAAPAQVIRADNAYVEMKAGVWDLLLADVADGASEEELDRLRGRQVWLRTPNGTVLRYGHLSGVASGIEVGRNVYRGQVIGYVGNSGTDDGVAGTRDGARLRFEIWEDEDTFFGEGADVDEVRLAAASLFVGP